MEAHTDEEGTTRLSPPQLGSVDIFSCSCRYSVTDCHMDVLDVSSAVFKPEQIGAERAPNRIQMSIKYIH